MYKLHDFKPRYHWRITYKGGIYQLGCSLNGNWQLATPGQNWEILGAEIDNFQQAKICVALKYGLPTTGWQAYSKSWVSNDKKVCILKQSFSHEKWSTILDGSFLKERFSSRQSAIDWINKQESCDVPA